MTPVLRCCLAVGLVATLAAPLGAASIKYPKTKTVDHVDEYHGTEVADPYRWLENDVRESKDVTAWVEAQNEVTFGFLDRIPERDAIRERLTELWNYEKFGIPRKQTG